MQLVTRRELCLFIATEFDWKPHSLEALNKNVDTAGDSAQELFLGQVNIELCLTKRRMQKLGYVNTERYTINEALLRDEAFFPKQYTLSLAKGEFNTVDDTQWNDLSRAPKFAYRLTFDYSPFPPRDEWKEPKGAPDAVRFWEWKEFFSRQIAVRS